MEALRRVVRRRSGLEIFYSSSKRMTLVNSASQFYADADDDVAEKIIQESPQRYLERSTSLIIGRHLPYSSVFSAVAASSKISICPNYILDRMSQSEFPAQQILYSITWIFKTYKIGRKFMQVRLEITGNCLCLKIDSMYAPIKTLKICGWREQMMNTTLLLNLTTCKSCCSFITFVCWANFASPFSNEIGDLSLFCLAASCHMVQHPAWWRS